MVHACPYFHDESLIPDAVRESLEQRLEHFFIAGHSEREQGSPDSTRLQADSRARVLDETIDALLNLASPVTRLTQGNAELAQRLSHETVHRIGHAFADSNEMHASEALARLRSRLRYMSPEEGWEEVSRHIGGDTERGDTERGDRILGILKTSSHGEKELRALQRSLSSETEKIIDTYEGKISRSAMRTMLPEIATGLIEDAEHISSTSGRIEDLFGVSSQGWDLKSRHWREIPWDVFALSSKFLNDDPSIMRLAEQLGRSPSGTPGKRSRKVDILETVEVIQQNREYDGRSEILGIENGGDINRVLPSEFAYLLDSDTEWRFYKELLERELVINRYRSSRSSAKVTEENRIRQVEVSEPHGPLIICADTSGSMAGLPEQVAKALALALIRICMEEKRRLYLILFATEIQELDLSNLDTSIEALSAFFHMEFRGGTDLRPALRRSTELMEREQFEDADLLIISDFKVPKIMIKQHSSLERVRNAGGNRIHALTIGTAGVIDVYNIFDSTWLYTVSAQGTGLGVLSLVDFSG